MKDLKRQSEQPKNRTLVSLRIMKSAFSCVLFVHLCIQSELVTDDTFSHLGFFFSPLTIMNWLVAGCGVVVAVSEEKLFLIP